MLVDYVESGCIYPVFLDHRFGKRFEEFLFRFPADADGGSFKERQEFFAIDIVELEKIIVDESGSTDHSQG